MDSRREPSTLPLPRFGTGVSGLDVEQYTQTALIDVLWQRPVHISFNDVAFRLLKAAVRISSRRLEYASREGPSQQE